jgi:hypothetical protein
VAVVEVLLAQDHYIHLVLAEPVGIGLMFPDLCLEVDQQLSRL